MRLKTVTRRKFSLEAEYESKGVAVVDLYRESLPFVDSIEIGPSKELPEFAPGGCAGAGMLSC